MKSKKYKYLSWDSKFFGFKVVQLSSNIDEGFNMESVLHDLRKDGCRLAYWFVSDALSTRKGIAKKCNGIFADDKVTFVKKLDRRKKYERSKNIYSYLGKPLNKRLEILAVAAGEHSRFNLDPNFGKKSFKLLYKEWIKFSLKGKISDEVLVYKDGRKEVAFIAIKKTGRLSKINLIATGSNYRNKGIGTALVNAAFNKSLQWGCTSMEVTTQGQNVPACKFYESLGFRLQKRVYVYHFWL